MTSQDYNLLVTLLKIPDQHRCLRLVSQVLSEYYDDDDFNVEWHPEFTYAKGKIPILLVAHCDTVCTQPVTHIGACASSTGAGSALTNMEQAPLGADDRAGIFIILKIIAEGYRPHILLTTDEEVGGLGAMAAADKLYPIPNVKFILELDRQGADDAAMYDCNNHAFMEMLQQYKFNPVNGTFSDICFFAPEWDIAAANLSVGYYHEHTPWELLDIREMEYTLKRIKQILDNVENFSYYKFESKNDKYSYATAISDINFRAEMSYAAHMSQKKKKKKKGGKKKVQYDF